MWKDVKNPYCMSSVLLLSFVLSEVFFLSEMTVYLCGYIAKNGQLCRVHKK